MVKREAYLKRIRPFINQELIKVMTGIRRSGKSVMLELINAELVIQGVGEKNFISFSFEDMSCANLLTADYFTLSIPSIRNWIPVIHGMIPLYENRKFPSMMPVNSRNDTAFC